MDPRTTNMCEGWHNAFNAHFLCSHPSIWKLMKDVQEDIALSRMILNRARTGGNEPGTKKYYSLAERVAATVQRYPGEPDKLRFLRSLAALQ